MRHDDGREIGGLDADATALVRSTVRHVLETSAPDEVAAALHRAGWDEVVAADAETAHRVLFDEIGRGLSSTPLLDTVVAEALGVDPFISRTVFPLPGSEQAVVDEAAVGVGIGGWPDQPPSCLVVLAPMVMVLRDPASGAASSSPISGLDPDLRASHVTVDVSRWSESGTRSDASRDAAVAACRRALAQQVLGGAQVMLELATGHAKVRHQFGRPIGTFQAVKHHLADVYVALHAAETALDQAWESGGALEAELAKALAGDAAAVAARWTLQVLGAIGFTWGHALHRYVRRNLMLNALLGSSDQIRRRLGTTLVETASVPRVGAL